MGRLPTPSRRVPAGALIRLEIGLLDVSGIPGGGVELHGAPLVAPRWFADSVPNAAWEQLAASDGSGLGEKVPDCEEIPEAIGTPDYEVSIVMNASGQFELFNTSTGESEIFPE